MLDIELDKTMSKSQFHKVRLVTKAGREVIGYCNLYESEWDSGEGEPCIGITGIKIPNLFYISNIESLEILD